MKSLAPKAINGNKFTEAGVKAVCEYSHEDFQGTDVYFILQPLKVVKKSLKYCDEQELDKRKT